MLPNRLSLLGLHDRPVCGDFRCAVRQLPHLGKWYTTRGRFLGDLRDESSSIEIKWCACLMCIYIYMCVFTTVRRIWCTRYGSNVHIIYKYIHIYDPQSTWTAFQLESCPNKDFNTVGWTSLKHLLGGNLVDSGITRGNYYASTGAGS